MTTTLPPPSFYPMPLAYSIGGGGGGGTAAPCPAFPTRTLQHDDPPSTPEPCNIQQPSLNGTSPTPEVDAVPSQVRSLSTS